jgi:HK97 gp10 family phage protein
MRVRSSPDRCRLRVHRDSGKLAESIRLERGRHPLRVLVRAGGPLTTKDGYDHALANEFGTEKLQAQPFFWPAYRANKTKLRGMIS